VVKSFVSEKINFTFTNQFFEIIVIFNDTLLSPTTTHRTDGVIHLSDLCPKGWAL
jgi:hypothetical protein